MSAILDFVSTYRCKRGTRSLDLLCIRSVDFSNVDPMSRDVSASGRGFMATPMLIFCVFHSGIPCPSK